ncbi:YafY family protein [Flavihumibacter sp. CACIAM 22H1]|uniref:helix-turn-helix transcriptional regulator n=1 Tax=Flavihumibacter sp. CACIAM 22H1 TaxID=1812911 RepID=UPI0007A9306C|nr:YafY family protein [Flavihumibacter sp. CACIAM 22H1]KYP13330.1 MAG: DNA-binding protein [Flavihumibacter sp. CACIAM 22H1]
MNRIDRLTAILIHLQSRRLVKAQEIADRFNISLRTVYRDVKAIEESGVPIIGEAGQGYTIMEGYRLPPVMFTREEALSFLTAEKLVDKFTDAGTRDSFQSAMYKVRAVLRSSEKDLLENVESFIEVYRHCTSTGIEPDSRFQQTILTSVALRKAVKIQYFSNYKREKTSRLIEPLGLFFMNNQWHLIAYCRMRADYRDFRLDRITELRISEESYSKKHISLQEYLQKEQSDQPLTEVVIQLPKKYVHYLGDQKYYMGLIRETELGENFELQFMTPSLMGFARWIIMFGDVVTICRPSQLLEKLAELAKSVVDKIHTVSDSV